MGDWDFGWFGQVWGGLVLGEGGEELRHGEGVRVEEGWWRLGGACGRRAVDGADG